MSRNLLTGLLCLLMFPGLAMAQAPSKFTDGFAYSQFHYIVMYELNSNEDKDVSVLIVKSNIKNGDTIAVLIQIPYAGKQFTLAKDQYLFSRADYYWVFGKQPPSKMLVRRGNGYQDKKYQWKRIRGTLRYSLSGNHSKTNVVVNSPSKFAAKMYQEGRRAKRCVAKIHALALKGSKKLTSTERALAIQLTRGYIAEFSVKRVR